MSLRSMDGSFPRLRPGKPVNKYSRFMQDAQVGKAARQRLIGSLIARKRVGTQVELLAALAGAGCRVTQATVSRDIHELGLQKTRDALGRPRYELPPLGG